jgi:hypothetical protein
MVRSLPAQDFLYGTNFFDSEDDRPQKNGEAVQGYIEIEYADFKPMPIEHGAQLAPSSANPSH